MSVNSENDSQKVSVGHEVLLSPTPSEIKEQTKKGKRATISTKGDKDKRKQRTSKSDDGDDDDGSSDDGSTISSSASSKKKTKKKRKSQRESKTGNSGRRQDSVANTGGTSEEAKKSMVDGSDRNSTQSKRLSNSSRRTQSLDYELNGDDAWEDQRKERRYDPLSMPVKSPRETVKDYLLRHKIGGLFDMFLVSLLKEKPDKPVHFLYDLVRDMNQQRTLAAHGETLTEECACNDLIPKSVHDLTKLSIDND